MAENTQLAVAVPQDQQAALAVRQQVNQIQYLLRDVLKEGEHYGTIPGVSKPSLMQSGAEKICYMFKLVPHFDVRREDIAGMPGHREYTVTCTLTGPDGLVKGEAVASCTTMESRYRWRNVADWEDTGEPIPKDARQRKQEYRRQGLGMKKVDGQWLWVRYLDSAKQENPDIADTWNTVLQMAEKRAFVRATRSTTAASDIFTQDVEDMPQYARPVAAGVTPAGQAPARPQPTEAEKARMAEVAGIGSFGERADARQQVWHAYLEGGMPAVERMALMLSEPPFDSEAPANVDPETGEVLGDAAAPELYDEDQEF